MIEGDEFLAREHPRTKKTNHFRIDKLYDNAISCVNVNTEPSNIKGGYIPSIYYTDIAMTASEDLGLIQWVIKDGEITND